MVQADSGMNRAIWAVPFALAIGGGGLVWQLSKRWKKAGDEAEDKAEDRITEELESDSRDDYDDKLDAELRDLE